MSDRARRVSRLLALLGAAGVVGVAPAGGQSWQTLTSSRQLWGAEPVSVRVEYGAGRLEVAPADRSLLYRMTLRYDQAEYQPVSSFDEATRTLRLGVDRRERRGRLDHAEGAHASIALTREAPLDLDLDFGAGEAQIDLGGLRLRRVEISTGASETTIDFDEPNPIRAEEVRINAGAADLTVRGLGNARASRVSFQGGVGSTVLDFSGAWAANASASVKLGMGAVVLRFPRDLGVRIDRSAFLTSFDAEGMVRREGSFFSSNWGSARHRLTLDVEAALGSIEVDWID